LSVEREVLDRSTGRSVFGRDPAAYDRARPGHPDEVYEILRERCGLGPGTSVLEVGPGTGQVTRRLLELGAAPVVAVEPDPELARYLASAIDGSVGIRQAPLEEVELPADVFDLAVAASSFHWVDAERGLAAVFAALRREGWWAMWWTHYGDKDRPDPFRDAIDPLVGGLASSPGARGFARDPEAALRALADAGFEEARLDRIQGTYEFDTAGIRALFASFSPFIVLEDAERERLLDEIARVAEDEFGGRVVKPVSTPVYTARKPV
jgi:SAM-dependent methyltransferase